jgi:hypothetical protein
MLDAGLLMRRYRGQWMRFCGIIELWLRQAGTGCDGWRMLSRMFNIYLLPKGLTL